jgi:steroid delta-isomerase-like uncharacterized protein
MTLFATALTRDQMDRLLDEHFRHELTDDVEGAVDTLATDVVHDMVGWPAGPSHGRDAARAFYEQLFADLAGEAVTSLHRYYGDNFMVDESRWDGRAVGNPLGLPGGGRPLSFRILHVLEFEPDGKIKRENVWIDYAAIIRQLAPPA